MRPVAALPVQEDALETALRDAGFADPATALRLIAGWRSGQMRVLRSAASRDALERVLPELVRAFGRAPAPDTALLRCDAMLAGLPSVVNLFHLMHAQPRLLGILVAVLSFAPTLAAALGRTPELLEGLIDASALGGVPSRAEIDDRLTRAPPGEAYEQLLDRVRRDVGELRFALGTQIIEAVSDPLDAACGYALVAEAAIDVLTSATVREFEAAHGRVPGGELLILALGRLGGQALTHASDLDVILLFTGDYLAESDGPRPLGATTYFNRLAQRVIAALSVPTAAGPLYEVDTRLRPQGKQGPLVAALDAFARYQREEAWTWEHMALTRARPVFGSASARAALEQVIGETLHMSRNVEKVRADVAAMRRDLRTHKPPAGPLDVKLMEGGLVDLEFALHFQQLTTRTAFHPRLGPALDRIIAAGLAPADILTAYQLLGRMLVALRLMSADLTVDNADTQARIATACGCADWRALMIAYDNARSCVTAWLAALKLDRVEEDDNNGTRFTRP
jgi:[glutamine synthetase] adenylyltransferase / [glutamine synthetase]-adenylyl-L-tyrosine phosphorylase